MRLKVLGIVVLVGAVVLTVACIGGVLALALVGGGSASSRDHVALIPVEGTIVSSGGGSGLLGGSSVSADWLIDQLEHARKDRHVKAIILEVNSPGGSANASQEISMEIERVKADGIPVVAAFRDVAASGGYYISAPADRIVALPGTITGSIGVIAEVPNMRELYDKLGIDTQVVKSGPFKDMMSPARPLTEEERQILNELISEVYDDFVKVVAEGRNLPEGQVRELADGRIYSGRQALDLGLVDELGDVRRAREIAGELGGLGSDPEVVAYGRSDSFLDFLLGQAANRLGLDLGGPAGLPVTSLRLRY